MTSPSMQACPSKCGWCCRFANEHCFESETEGADQEPQEARMKQVLAG